MSHTVGQIAAALQVEAEGDLDLIVTGAAEPADAGPEQIALAMNPKYAEALGQGRARAAMLWPGADWRALGLRAALFPPRPRFAMAGLTAMLDPGQGWDAGIHDQTAIDPSAEIGRDVSIGPFTVVGAGARVGDGAVIGPNCVIGAQAELGPGAWLREGVTIGARVKIGARFIAQPGARIGSDGFSFVTPEKSRVEAARESLGSEAEGAQMAYVRIHSLGAVVIGDDVEIGANTTVDSGTIRPTRIGNGTKLDNLVQIGHNCVIGDNTLLCGQVGLAGSVRVGNNVVLGGQVGVSDNIFVGDGVMAGGGTKIFTNAPAGRVLLGHPATKMDTQMSIYKAIRRLPRLVADVAALQKAVFKSDAKD